MRQSMAVRRGFTLLELLVVLAIIGILVTLVAAAVFRLQNARDEVVTNETLEKIQGGFDLQRKAAMDLIRKEQPPAEVLYVAGNDLELAKVIHMKLRLRQEFPDKVTELSLATLFPAITPTGNVQLDTAINNIPSYYRPKATYTQPMYLAAVMTLPATEQNASLLALVLSISRGSVTFDSETAVGGAGTSTAGSTSLKLFKDRWGRSIEFRRHSPTTGGSADPYMASVIRELNFPPYTSGKTRTSTHGDDALDPDNRLQRTDMIATRAKALLDYWLGEVNTGDNRPTIIFSQGAKLGVNGDELYGFRLKGTGKGS